MALHLATATENKRCKTQLAELRPVALPSICFLRRSMDVNSDLDPDQITEFSFNVAESAKND